MSIIFIIPINMKKKKRRTELESAENRYQSLLEKRNELNTMARSLREERDMINQRKRTTADHVSELKKNRDRLVGLRREHIKLRNRYQAQAKEIIARKRDRTKKIYPSLPREVEARKAELQMLDQRQQTTSLSIDAERELIETIKKKQEELADLEKQLTEQSALGGEVTEMDANIDELFKKADEQHAKVVEFSKEIDELHERMSALVEELSMMNNESDKKHQAFLKVRQRADHYHQKAQEMRQKIMAIKREKRADEREAKKEVRAHSREVQKYFEDKEALTKHKDDELDKLKKGKKIEL